MMKRFGDLKPLIGSTLSVVPVSFLKISPIWGSYLSFFTPTQIIVPFAGSLVSRKTVIGSWIARTAWYGATHTASLPYAVCYHLPTTAAALFMATPITITSRIATVAAFSAAATLFGSAVGATQALLYACLWVVPALLAAYGARNSVARSCIATFLAHACGSAIWAWAFPLAPAAWVALIPVALAERLCSTAGIAALLLFVRLPGMAPVPSHSPLSA